MTDSNQVKHIEKSLRRISYFIKQQGREILTQFPITPPQFIALQYLQDKGDLTTGELSTRMSLAFSTTTDLVDRLEKNGLVARVKDKRDRRVVRVHILSKGKKIIDEVIQKRQEYLLGVLENFSTEEADNLEETLTALYHEITKKR